MVEYGNYGPKWRQDDYDRIRDALRPVNISSFSTPSVVSRRPDEGIKLDIFVPEPIEFEEFVSLKDVIVELLEHEAGMRVESAEVAAPYEGAMDPGLAVGVTFKNPVYEEEV